MRATTVAALYQTLTVLLEREIIHNRPTELNGDIIGVTVTFTRGSQDGNITSEDYFAECLEKVDGQFIVGYTETQPTPKK